MNLLEQPIFSVRGRHGIRRISLPELLAGLGHDEVKTLRRLQRYQEDSFHMFLCYLGAAVLASKGLTEPRQTANFWRSGLRKLTDRTDDAAWTLVVEDVTKPAFMQPPLRSTKLFGAFKPKATTPDAL